MGGPVALRAEPPIREPPGILRDDTVWPPGSGDVVRAGRADTLDLVVHPDPPAGDVRRALPRQPAAGDAR